MISKRLEKWFAKFKLYFFTYKNGFFELPYLANSPEAMINSISKMPFTKHYPNKNFIKSNTPFLKADIYYQFIEDNIVLLVTQIQYKANVNYKMIYDKHLPVQWYFLTFQVNENPSIARCLVINGLNFADKSWTFFKPGADVSNHHFKGENCILLSLYFTEKALKNIFFNQKEQDFSVFKTFLDAKLQYLICPKTAAADVYKHEPMFELLKLDAKKADKVVVKQHTLAFFNAFIFQLNQQNLNKKHFEIGNLERIKILEVERLLTNAVYSKFPTIAFLATEVGISETNLKSIFKFVYGVTLFQYYQVKQMDIAKTIIIEGKLKIKEVAHTMGYENVGKFSVAYKKHFGICPSKE